MLRLSLVLKMAFVKLVMDEQHEHQPPRVAWTFFMSPVRASRYEGSMATE